MFIMSPCTAETDLDCHREFVHVSNIDLPPYTYVLRLFSASKK